MWLEFLPQTLYIMQNINRKNDKDVLNTSNIFTDVLEIILLLSMLQFLKIIHKVVNLSQYQFSVVILQNYRCLCHWLFTDTWSTWV